MSTGISPFFLIYSYNIDLLSLARQGEELRTTRNSLVAYREAFVAKLKEAVEVVQAVIATA